MFLSLSAHIGFLAACALRRLVDRKSRGGSNLVAILLKNVETDMCLTSNRNASKMMLAGFFTTTGLLRLAFQRASFAQSCRFSRKNIDVRMWAVE